MSVGESQKQIPARFYKPPKPETQSGMARTKQWLLFFEQDKPREIEPLMGWTSSGDTRQQLRLWFDTKEEAMAYAEREGIAYRVEDRKSTRLNSSHANISYAVFCLKKKKKKTK